MYCKTNTLGVQRILKSLIAGLLLTSSLNADFARIEMGAGAWIQTPTGSITTSTNSNILSLAGTYNTYETTASETYVWILVKHPVPLIPNLRIEYVTISDSGNFDRFIENIYVGKSPTTIDMTQIDLIPYYNILDNTFWTTIDLGLNLKVIQADVDVDAFANETGVSALDPLVTVANRFLPNYSSSDQAIIPLAYIRARIQIPTTYIGLESDLKYISFDGSTVYDFRAKVDYTFDISPIIQPALEVGYRVQKFDIDTDDTFGSLEYSGAYVGLMLRF